MKCVNSEDSKSTFGKWIYSTVGRGCEEGRSGKERVECV